MYRHFHFNPHSALQIVGRECYKAEPYAWVSNIIGPDNPKYGWANVTQVTGTAAWMDIAASQYLLGIRPELGGLRIAPVLPDDWSGFSATRRFRGCELRISVTRGKGAGRLLLDDKALDGQFIPAGMIAGRSEASVLLELPG